MIPHDRAKVGDIILYKRKKKIMEWEINTISSSGKYFEIENDDWSERWVYIGDILEILESGEDEVEITEPYVCSRPVIESKFKV